MKADTVRECIVSSLFTVSLLSLVTNFVLLDRYLLEHHSNNFPDDQDNDIGKNNDIGHESLKWLLNPSTENIIHVGIIMKNVAKKTEKALKFKEQFVVLLQSLVKESKRQPIHFLLLSDPDSVPVLTPIMRNVIKTLGTVQITFDFFNCNAITKRFPHEISHLRPYFTSISEQAKKYRDDLFLMAPFYHRILPYNRLIMLDADLRFKVPLEELYDFFDEFADQQIIGVGPDLSPHYMHVLREYRNRTPGTPIGEPGPTQGFNTGVVLFDLTKMRASSVYNEYVLLRDGKSIENLSTKYSFRSHLGDQCLFTLLGIEHPELFHYLPCEYNYQLDNSMFQDPFVEVFPLYHNCMGEPKIYHGNGGFPVPMTEAEETEWRWRWPPTNATTYFNSNLSKP